MATAITSNSSDYVRMLQEFYAQLVEKLTGQQVDANSVILNQAEILKAKAALINDDIQDMMRETVIGKFNLVKLQACLDELEKYNVDSPLNEINQYYDELSRSVSELGEMKETFETLIEDARQESMSYIKGEGMDDVLVSNGHQSLLMTEERLQEIQQIVNDANVLVDNFKPFLPATTVDTAVTTISSVSTRKLGPS